MTEFHADTAEDSRALRRMLAICYGKGNLYTDDGELQDSLTSPAIDFKRDSTASIRRKMLERAMHTLTTVKKP